MYKRSQVIAILLLTSVRSMLKYPSKEGKFFYMGIDSEIDPSSFDL